MLRRIKRKAPLPPSNGNNSNSSEIKARPTSEPSGKASQNGKRTRKFGVITRTPSGGKEAKGSKGSPRTERENGHCALMEVDGIPPGASKTESKAENPLPRVDSPFPVGQYRARLSDGGILDLNASELSLQMAGEEGEEPAGDMKPGESRAIKGLRNAEARKSALRTMTEPQTSVTAVGEPDELQGNHLCLQVDC
ncbi:UNVERIFIED_CONTAM: hypothetical protein K2H54_066199 [Gekko kuhli]